MGWGEGRVGGRPDGMEGMGESGAERGGGRCGSDRPDPPSCYIAGDIGGCICDDETGLRNRDAIGMDQICFEVDFPHADTTYPHALAVA